MKNNRLIRHLLAAGIASGVFLFGACKKPEEKPTPPAASYSGGSNPSDSAGQRAMDRTREAAADTADAIRDGTTTAWASLKDATYDQRVAFRDGVNRLADDVDARMANLKQGSSELSKEGMDRLRDARANLKEKIKDLGNATADNWDSAKAAVADAWNRVELSCRELEQKMRS
jgi:hypothetical protein